MNQDNTIKILLVIVAILAIALVLRITVFKDTEIHIDLSSNSVVNAVANKTNDYVNSTNYEKNKYNEVEQSMDKYFNKIN